MRPSLRKGIILRDVLRRSAIRSAAETVAIVPGMLRQRSEVLGTAALVLSGADRSVSTQLRLAAEGAR